MISQTLLQTTLDDLHQLKFFVEKEKIAIPEGVVRVNSYRNMCHYLRMRGHDITNIQENLSKLGLSSIGRSQSHILYTINQILFLLSKATEKVLDIANDTFVTYNEANEIFLQNLSIFGTHNNGSKHSQTKIMITLPSEAAENFELIEQMVQSGAKIFRINTAHDASQIWQQMVDHIKTINQDREEKEKIKIYVDLAGPKIRTGKIKKVFSEVKIKLNGNTSSEILLVSPEELERRAALSLPNSIDDRVIAVNQKFLKKCRHSDFIEVIDAHQKQHYLKIVETDETHCLCKLKKKIFLDNTSVFKVYKNKKIYEALPENIEPEPEKIQVHQGNLIYLTFEEVEGFLHEESDDIIATISCTSKEALEVSEEGDHIFIDDGKVGLKMVDKKEQGIVCEVVQAKEKGVYIKEEKGVNFPDRDLNIPALTKEDRNNLEVILPFADIVGLSFTQTDEDVKTLVEICSALGYPDTAIVTKIETKKGVANLPNILTELLKHKQAAVMIARGDLAVEAGFENLAYLQEEILDLCASAHMPVIYATQVLENLMKNNLPSRSEIVDAGLAQRADCVMLNKGPFVVNTIKTLDNILEQMHMIFQKNRQLLSVCHTWKQSCRE